MFEKKSATEFRFFHNDTRKEDFLIFYYFRAQSPFFLDFTEFGRNSKQTG